MEAEKENLAEFIEIYKSLPSLWKIKSKDYSNRNIKNAEYEVLVQKLKERNPEASKDVVIKKINNLRSAYRRELRKKKDSLRSGAGAEDEYVPTLWYYDMLSFLDDQEESSVGLNTMENNTSSCEEATSPPTKRRKKEVSEEDKLIQMACEKLQRCSEPTEGDSLAQSWATQYNELDASQKIIARKIMSDVFFQGCMVKLQIGHALQIQNIFNAPTQMPTPQSVKYQYASSAQPVIAQYPLYTPTQHHYSLTKPRNVIIRVPTPLSSDSSIGSSRLSTPQMIDNFNIEETINEDISSSMNYSSDENIKNFFAGYRDDD